MDPKDPGVLPDSLSPQTNPIPALSGHDTQLRRAVAQTEKAEARADLAELRTEQGEVKRRASEFNYRRLFEAAREGIMILETDTGRVSDANPFLIEMLGHSHDELVGGLIWELGSFRDIVANKAKFDELQREGYVLYENLPIETKDGRKITVEFISLVYQADEQNVIQCNVRDVSKRRLAEVEIRTLNAELERRVAERTAELQNANQELEAFSYSVSHDLRTPLRHVLGFVDMLQTQTAQVFSVENQSLLARITLSAKRMGNLIEDLLRFSRIGKSDLVKGEVNLNALITEILTDLGEDTKGRRITWRVASMPTVRADHALLRMVLVNLMLNAVKFTSTRAEADIEIGFTQDEQHATVLFVRDNGVGFDPMYAHKLFGVFQRLHSADDFEGTGVGLANVQRIIQRHGGRAWAEGAVDCGAAFYVSIPE